MRVFVVLASIVVLASADVKHLYDAPYNNGASTNGQVQKQPAPIKHLYDAPSGSNLANFGHNGGSNGFVQPTNNNRFGSDSVGSLPVATNYGGQVVNGPANNGFGNNGPISTGPSNSGFRPANNNGNGNNGFFGPSSNSGFGPATSGNNGFGPVNGGNYQDTNGHKINFQTKLVKQTMPLVSKSSYVYSAPEDLEDIQREQTIVLPRPRQHYKVVFIKAPSTTIVNSPSTGAGGQVQEKTLIYVLSDKKRIENHIDVPEDLQSKPQKPEVFFVKYNKPTEVVNSQIKYETVDAVNGAENGAINGVPNKVTNNGPLRDEAATPEQNQIAQTIHEALQNGGLQNGLNAVDKLINAGHPISGPGSDSFPTRGGFGGPTSGPVSSYGPAASGNIADQKLSGGYGGPLSSGPKTASTDEEGYVY